MAKSVQVPFCSLIGMLTLVSTIGMIMMKGQIIKNTRKIGDLCMKVSVIADYENDQLEKQLRTWAVAHIIEKYGIETEVWTKKIKQEEIKQENPSLLKKLKQLFRNSETNNMQADTMEFLDKYLSHRKQYTTREEFKQVEGSIDAYVSILPTNFENNESMTLQFIKEQPKYAVQKDPLFWLNKQDFEGFLIQSRENGGIALCLQEPSKELLEIAKQFAKTSQEKVIELSDNSCYDNQFKNYMRTCMSAKKIITDTTLGAIIAITHHIPFVYLAREEQTVSILQQLKLDSHIIKHGQELKEENFVWDIEEKTMNTRLRRWRRKPLYEMEEGLHITDNEAKVLCPTNILKKECYGCYACEKVCPTNAITMIEDKDGFPYPVTNEETCIHCGACERACPRLKDTNCMEEGFPKVRAVMNRKLEVRMGGSSSGAVFPELCKEFIEKRQGVVVGVTYDENMKVVSKIAETLDEAKPFRNSKYVKSQFAQNFPKVKELLQQGRYVLFTGLPCECASLRSYLKKDYDNLLIQEILCHAGPPGKLFQNYVAALEEEHGSKVVDFVFRDKRHGWHMSKCSVAVTFENGKELVEYAKYNDYFKAFLNDYLGRPSCSHCQFVGSHRCGDITVGDYWGIQKVFPKLYDNKGISLLIINTQKGWNYWNEIHDRFVVEKSSMKTAFRKNHSKPSPYKEERVQLFHRLEGKSGCEVAKVLHEYNNAVQHDK